MSSLPGNSHESIDWNHDQCPIGRLSRDKSRSTCDKAVDNSFRLLVDIQMGFSQIFHKYSILRLLDDVNKTRSSIGATLGFQYRVPWYSVVLKEGSPKRIMDNCDDPSVQLDYQYQGLMDIRDGFYDMI